MINMGNAMTGTPTSDKIAMVLAGENVCNLLPEIAKDLYGDARYVSYNGQNSLLITDQYGEQFVIQKASGQYRPLDTGCGQNNNYQQPMSNNNTQGYQNNMQQHPLLNRYVQAPMASANTNMAIGAMRKWRHA